MSDRQVSADVDFMEQLPAGAYLQLAVKKRETERALRQFGALIKAQPQLFLELERLGIEPRFDMIYGSVDIAISGDVDKLSIVWAALRRAGYTPRERPARGQPEFRTFWDPADSDLLPKAFLNFTSSVCRRVQVGTRTVEQPVFEIVCGETPALDKFLEGT